MIPNFIGGEFFGRREDVESKYNSTRHSAMAKSKKSTRGGRKEAVQTTGKLAPITSWEDVADSEDEFHLNRDKIHLDPRIDKSREQDDEGNGILYAFW